ncbi:MAG: hypothetical protein AAF985_06900, partial [Bacteroidota bacterium]
MTEEELRMKKLELEIRELAKPSWRKPAYLTIVVSVLTILLSTLIGFGRYFEKVDKANIQKIEELEEKMASNKEQQHKMEMAAMNYETLMTNQENEVVKESNAELKADISKNKQELKRIEEQVRKKEAALQAIEKEFRDYKSLVFGTIERYKKYSPNYARGVINSTSGQAKIKAIMAFENQEKQREAIGKFAYGVM